MTALEGVQAFVTHGSLSLKERRDAKHMFETGDDCVIVATSVLELGIDVGDLDRVIQQCAARRGALDHLKLQKLCFYAYGVALGLGVAEELGQQWQQRLASKAPCLCEA